MKPEQFVSINLSRLRSLANLTPTAWQLYVLLTSKIDRKRNREPLPRSNPFHLTFNDFIEYGIPARSFYRSLKELQATGFIRITGRKKQKMCEIIKW